MIYLQLMLVGLIPIAVSCGFYFIKKLNWFNNLAKRTQQIVIGVMFGVVAILGTILGVDVGDGVMANARDAGPLCAGLLFGSTAGILSGIIGGVFRALYYFIWGNGAYSWIACSVSTVVAGLFSASLRKFMFDDKRPTWPFALATGVVMEVFHMTVLFLTHLSASEKAVEIVEICTIPMILCNTFALTVSVVLLDIFSKSYKHAKLKYRHITQQIQMWLLLVVSLAYIATTSFVYVLQTGIAENSAKEQIEICIDNVSQQINENTTSEKISQYFHVGEEYVIIVDSDNKIVSINKDKENYLNNNLSEITNIDLSSYSEKTSFETKMFDEGYFCMYVVKDSYKIMGALSNTNVYELRESSVYVNSFMEVLVFALLFCIIYDLIKRKVVNNIRSVNQSLAQIIDGNLNVSVDVKSSEEFSSLSNDINTTVHTLRHYIDEASQRIDRELAFAKSIQHSAIPSVFPAYPNISEFDIYATMFTAKEVGGDFYDFYTLGDKLVFLIADVSGKGIPAAMFMMRVKTLLKSLTETGMDISQSFTIANDKLCLGNDAGMFVTAWMGCLDYRTGEIEFVNAGHNPPLIYRKGHGVEKINCKAGFILAGMEGTKYKKQSIKLNKGDRIYLYTDGVTEATDVNNNLYGEGRFISFINDNQNESVDKILYDIKESVDEFAGEREQFDDITMLALQYNGSVGYIEKTFLADKSSFNEVNSFVKNILDENNAIAKAKTIILIAIEEIFVNISSYAYGDKTGKLTLKIKVENDLMTIKFIDSGSPFNPLKKPDPDVTLSAEERNIGGLGIFMVKKTMDNMYYENIEGRNILTLEKKIK